MSTPVALIDLFRPAGRLLLMPRRSPRYEGRRVPMEPRRCAHCDEVFSPERGITEPIAEPGLWARRWTCRPCLLDQTRRWR